MISRGATIGADVIINGSMIMEGATIGEGTKIIDSYISAGISVSSHSALNGEILG